MAIAFEQSLGKMIKDIDPEYFLRSLCLFICSTKPAESSEFIRGEESNLEKADVEKLSLDDLEHIAQVFIENNEYLRRENIRKEVKNSDDSVTIASEMGEVIYPQEEGESHIKYLHRLASLYQDNFITSIAAQVTKYAEPFRNFSDSLRKNLKETFELGELLKKNIVSIPQSSIPKRDIKNMQQPKTISAFNEIDVDRLWRNAEQNRMKPFIEIYKRLDQQTGFLVEMNQLQANIGKEIKESGDKAAYYSKGSFWLTIVIIILTVAGIIANVYSGIGVKEHLRLVRDHQLLENKFLIQEKAIKESQNQIEQQQKMIMLLEKEIKDIQKGKESESK